MPEWKGKTRGGSLGYQIFISLLKHFGLRVTYVQLMLVVPYYILFAPKSTAASWYYWRHIHGKSRIKAFLLLFVHYFRFGQIIIDKIAALSGYDKKFKYEFHNYEKFLEILNGDTGVVMIGAHFGNWEMGGQFFGDYGKKINIVMYDAEYQKIKDKINNVTGGRHYQVIPVNDGDMSSVFLIKDALDRKEYVCFQGDRFMSENNLLRHSFLGHEARFPAGPFLVASRMHLPVVFYFAEKESVHRYSFNFFFANTPQRGGKTKPEMQLLEQYIDVLEQRIKVHPEQWFNFYQFWK